MADVVEIARKTKKPAAPRRDPESEARLLRLAESRLAIEGVTPEMRIYREETFGPLAPVVVFDTEDEAVAAANNTEFGLVSYVYTSEIKRALRVCERLETGMVWLNQGIVSNAAAPFGGVKHSGFGREGGAEGIEEYLSVKYVGLTP